jgi:predicted nucleic acid-binding protein
VALVNHRDQDHSRAVELSHTFTNQPLLTTDLVLIEIGDTLAGEFRREAAQLIDFFRRAANIKIVHLTTELFDEAVALYSSRRDKDWGMTDCVSFVVMAHEQVGEALTFDQHFEQAGFTALLRR